jgi:DNA-binding NtrC family response regulator
MAPLSTTAANRPLNIPDVSVLCLVSEVSPMRPITATVPAQRVDEEDETLAARHRLPVLISARCSSTVTRVARRIHDAASRPAGPFVIFPAAELLEQRDAFGQQWALLMDAGRGGTILISDIEEMPDEAQGLFAESMNQLLAYSTSTTAARLMTGTSASLFDRVRAGRFSEDLLYRLNVIHLHRREGCAPCPQCAARR